MKNGSTEIKVDQKTGRGSVCERLRKVKGITSGGEEEVVRETLISTEKKKLLTKTIAKKIINPFLTNLPILNPLTNFFLSLYHYNFCSYTFLPADMKSMHYVGSFYIP